jgi:polyisoprenoid-binding protein YceI
VAGKEPAETPPTLLSGSFGRWQLDPSTTTIELHTKAMWGLVGVKGHLKAIDGGVTVRKDGTTEGEFVIDANSIDTNNKKRDAHLRSSDFFEVDRHPTLIFVATSMNEAGAGHFKVNGVLIIKGQSRPMELIVKAVESSPGRLILTAETDIDRGEWNITWTKMGARLISHIVIVVQLIRPWHTDPDE